MTVYAFEEGGQALARGRILMPSSHKCLVRFVTDDERGEHRDVDMPYGHLFHPCSTDAAYEASRVLMQLLNQFGQVPIGEALRHVDQLRSIGLRLQAEVYELGAHAGVGKLGLASCGMVSERNHNGPRADRPSG